MKKSTLKKLIETIIKEVEDPTTEPPFDGEGNRICPFCGGNAGESEDQICDKCKWGPETDRIDVDENMGQTIPSGVWWPKPNDKIIFEIGTSGNQIVAKYRNASVGILYPKNTNDTSINSYHIFRATDPRFSQLNNREASLKVLHAYLTRIVELQIEKSVKENSGYSHGYIGPTLPQDPINEYSDSDTRRKAVISRPDDSLKLIYAWVKQGSINFQEFEELVVLWAEKTDQSTFGAS